MNRNFASTNIKELPPFLIVAVAFIGLSVVFRDALVLIYQSWRQEEYSHGYLIMPLAALVAANSLAHHHAQARASWVGFGMIAVCIALMFVFEISGVKGLLPQLYIIAIAGLAVACLGPRLTAALTAPFGLLLLALPQPAFIYYNLSFNMRLLSTSLGVGALRALDIPVLQDGNIIDLGNYQLQVADACNGLRYLFPLLSLSFLVAYLYKTSLWKRVFLFFSALPITILMNGLRIGLIGVTVSRWGPTMATGVLHDFEGWVFFMCCVLSLLLEVRLLQSVGARGQIDASALRIPHLADLPSPSLGAPLRSCAALIFPVAILAIAAPTLSTDYVRAIPLRQSFDMFPRQIGEWNGQFNELDAVSLDVLGTNDYLLADYVQPAIAAPVTLYLLYYSRQDSTSNGAVHSPTTCLPAGGWAILLNSVKSIPLPNGKPLSVNRVLISKGSVRGVVYYWYNQGGNAMRVPASSRLFLLKHAITTGTTNGAMIRVNTELGAHESPESAEARLDSFLRVALKPMNDFMF